MTELNSKMWRVTLTRIGLFMLQQFLHISCLRTVISNGPAHCLNGKLAGPNVAFNYRIISCSGVF